MTSIATNISAEETVNMLLARDIETAVNSGCQVFAIICRQVFERIFRADVPLGFYHLDGRVAERFERLCGRHLCVYASLSTEPFCVRGQRKQFGVRNNGKHICASGF